MINDMEDQVIQIVKEIIKDNDIQLTNETDILNEVGLNSAQMMQLFLKTEDTFHIVIDFGNFHYSCLSSISGFCDYITKLQSV
jgi:acyl carrier protein